VAAKLAAVVSSGGSFPDSTATTAGDVIIWSGEDSIEDTLLPRLTAAGADLDRCIFPDVVGSGEKQRPFDPLIDIPLLESYLREAPHPVKLLIVDPIVSFAAGSSNQAVRQSLTPLVRLAEQYSVAIIGITHVAKGSNKRPPKERILGVQAFVALSRVVMMTGVRPTGEPVLLRVKSNLGPDDGAYPYRMEGVALAGGIHSSRVTFGAYLDLSANEILGSVRTERDPSNSALDAAKEFLLDVLSLGMQESAEVALLAEEAGHSRATLRRAKSLLGVLSDKQGDQWWWMLPPEEDAQDDEHLDDEHLGTLIQ
jgi:putative DNA primase/helicase